MLSLTPERLTASLELAESINAANSVEIRGQSQVQDVFRYFANPNKSGVDSRIWKKYSELSTMEMRGTGDTGLKRRQIMIIHMLTWEWLDFIVYDGYKHHMENKEHFLNKLYKKIELIIKAPDMARNLDASEFIPGFKKGEATFAYKKRGRERYREGSKDEYIKQATVVLRAWYQFPEGNSESQAAFLRGIIKYVGYDILFLDSTWDAFNNMHKMIFGEKGKRMPSKEHIQEWVETQFAKWDICNPESDERQVLARIGENLEWVEEDKQLKNALNTYVTGTWYKLSMVLMSIIIVRPRR